MKDYFLNLFRYDRYANLQILETIFKANQPQNTVKCMAHLLAAQQIWLSRCKGLPTLGVSLTPDWQAVQFKYMIEENSAEWMAYLNGLNDRDFGQLITYTNLKGEPFQTSIIDIVTQVTNHGTHHRAQIGQQLKLWGIETLPVTDYIYFIRKQNP